jgi:L-ascorbate metabolism protein UlaG (beta-lactamase superfamily)
MRRVLKISLSVVVVLLVLVGCVVLYVLSWAEFGGSADGEVRARMVRSSQYVDEAKSFANTPPPPGWDIGTNLEEMMGDQKRIPPGPFPIVTPSFEDPPPPGLRATWFGHATVLVEIDGRRVMFDPMMSDHAFPVKMVAPQRFNPPPMALEELPKVDIVTVSHDHFDHLDMATVQHLAQGGTHFFVGLGIGAHLKKWDVSPDQIHELDWWESAEHAGLTVHCTPARHYSGRTAMDNSTLWASWVIEGVEHRVFHSGDTGYGPHFKTIGERRGPIDLSLIKIGDYGNDPAWYSIHMTPEDSLRGHVDLGAETLLPIHWGVFQLSYHDWDEPIRRALKAAEETGADMVTPRLGETLVVGEAFQGDAWWETIDVRN